MKRNLKDAELELKTKRGGRRQKAAALEELQQRQSEQSSSARSTTGFDSKLGEDLLKKFTCIVLILMFKMQ